MPQAQGGSEEFGLAQIFFPSHSLFISEYGLLPKYNDGVDPFDISMLVQRQLTMRFSAGFSIRPFIVADQERTLNVIQSWVNDPSNHLRRLCSEGTRPRLPWGIRLKKIVENPLPVISIIDQLKDDSSLYVRRSVANNLGDIAKDHPSLVFDLCDH
jgi:3-methyladenine DNA glycosylase AlkC